MGDVVKLLRPRQGTIRGAGHSLVTEAMRTVGKPVAIVVVALSADGSFSVRSASTGDFKDFDLYSRAAAVLDRQRLSFLDD